jgi:hypothetical protein
MDVWADPWQQHDEIVTSTDQHKKNEDVVLEGGWEEAKSYGQQERPVVAWDSPWASHERDNSRDRIDEIIESSNQELVDSLCIPPTNTTKSVKEDTFQQNLSWPEVVANGTLPEFTPSFSEATPEPSDDGGSLSPKSIRTQGQLDIADSRHTEDEHEEDVSLGLGISDEDYKPHPVSSASAQESRIVESKLEHFNISLIEKLYGNFQEERTDLEFSDDLLEPESTRATWNRISRPQTLRGWSSARDSFVRVTWAKSQVREQTLQYVSHWGRQGTATTPIQQEPADLFGWNTVSHSRNTSLISNTHISTPNSPLPARSHSRISSRDVPTPVAEATPGVQFSWSSSSGSLPWSDARTEQMTIQDDSSIEVRKEAVVENLDLKLDISGLQNISAATQVASSPQVVDEDAEWGDWAETVSPNIDAPTTQEDQSTKDAPLLDGPSSSALRMHLIAERNLAVPKSKKDIIMPESFYNELPAKSAIRTYLEKKKTAVSKQPSSTSQDHEPIPESSSSDSLPMEDLATSPTTRDLGMVNSLPIEASTMSTKDDTMLPVVEKVQTDNQSSAFDMLDLFDTTPYTRDSTSSPQNTTSQAVTPNLNFSLWDIPAQTSPSPLSVIIKPSPVASPHLDATDLITATAPINDDSKIHLQGHPSPSTQLPDTSTTNVIITAPPNTSDSTTVHQIIVNLSSFAYMLR